VATTQSQRGLLHGAGQLCWGCGVDVDAQASSCESCGSTLTPPPARIESELGLVYSIRRGVRKRRFVRVGERDGEAQLLSESGDVENVPSEQLPDADSEAISPQVAARLRTPAGRLLALAAAARGETTKRKWDAETLETAAVESAHDLPTARLVALDALSLEMFSTLDHLPLSDHERGWLRAVDATAQGSDDAAIDAICSLPLDRYRPKLVLLARQRRALGALTVDVRERLHGQIVAYIEEEPLAALLQRRLSGGEEDEESMSGALDDQRQLIERLSVAASRKRDLVASLELLDGHCPVNAEEIGPLPRRLRLLLALDQPRRELLDQDDVDAIPLPLLDDLIESGAISAGTVLAGSTNKQRTRYLLARLDPVKLSDEDVDGLDHHEERARRAFVRGDADALASLSDSTTVRHYQALAAFAHAQGKGVALEQVKPEARDLVRDLLALAAGREQGTLSTGGLTERLMEDPSAWHAVIEIAGSTAFTPSPKLQEQFPAFCEWLALHQAREHLFLGNWEAAVNATQLCLQLATREAVRDEALNLKGCALHYLGQDRRALGALEEAIGGERSEALLANLGIVAAGLEPEIAAQHLGMLMDEAPTVALRVSAAKRALEIWRESDSSSWRNSDNSPLPDAFQDSLRRLVLADLALDDFRIFATALAIYDGEWFANPVNTAGSPHRETLEARFYTARAVDLTQMISVMADAMAAGSPPEWVIDERNSLREASLEILFDNLDEPDSTFGTIALEMVEQGVLASEDDRVLFTALGIASVTYHLSMREQEVADRIATMAIELRDRWKQLPTEDRDRIEPVVELSTRRTAINRFRARGRDFDASVDIFNLAIEIGGRAEPGSPAYAEVLRRLHGVAASCRSVRDDLRMWAPIVDHENVRNDLNKLIESSREVEGRCLSILS
jgi:hypothetical protein